MIDTAISLSTRGHFRILKSGHFNFLLTPTPYRRDPAAGDVMRWPWQKQPEKLETQPFSDSVIQSNIRGSSGTTTPNPSAIGALENAASLYAARFSAASVNHPALTSGVVGLLARNLIKRGESLFRIVVEGGALALRPAGSWDVRGGPAEPAWFYRLYEFPSGNLTYFVPSTGVIHAKYAVDPSRP